MIHRIRNWWSPSDELERTNRHVRVAICLATFGLCVTLVGLIAWVRDNQQRAERADYQTQLIDWRRCLDRAESGVQIENVNSAAVAHAEDTAEVVKKTAATFDEIVAIIEAGGQGGPRLEQIRRTVDQYSRETAVPYQQGVNQYRAAAEAFVPQDPAECPQKPTPP